MPIAPISFGVRSNPGSAGAISAARLINCFAEDAGEEGKIKYPIVACDGFNLWSSGLSGTIRAGFALSDSALYVAAGFRINKLATDGTAIALSGSIAASGLITMARNRKEPNAQIGIVSSVGNAFYTVENDVLTDRAAAITALGSAGTLTSVAAIDGYFVLFFDNGEFFITSIDDASSIDDLDFAKAEANPDGGVKVLTRGRDVVLAGTASTEFWHNTGAADFPFERVTSADYGCYAAASMVNVTHARPDGEVIDTIAMAGTDAKGAYVGVILLNGYSGVKISSAAVDRSIRDETDKTTISAFSRTEGGRTFYTIRGSTFTWVYDFSTGFWHERTSSGLAFWRVWNAFSFNGMSILADYTLGSLYKSLSGIASGSDSSVTLKHSNDNGNTWVTRTSKTLSGSSNLKQRMRWNRLGQSKTPGKVFQITITNAVVENGTGNPMTVQPPTVHAAPQRMRFYGLYLDTIPGGSQTSTPKGITGLAVNAITLAA